MSLFDPWRTYTKLKDVPINELVLVGARVVLLDMDNTVVPWHTVDVSLENAKWLERAGEHGLQVYLFSNNNLRRTAKLAKLLGVKFICNACKPYGRGFRILESYVEDYDPARCVLIGDQVLTDVLGGNRHGVRTILLKPISSRESFWTRRMRFLERAFFPNVHQEEKVR